MITKKIIFFIITFCLISGITAQENIKLKLKDEDKPKGTLDGHTFITNGLVKSSFITSNISNSLGVGTTVDYQIPIIEVSGEEISALKGDLLFASLAIRFEHAIRNWIGFYGSFQLVTRIGSEPQALIAQGVNLSTTFDFGWQLKLFKNRKMMLSTFLGVSNVNATTIDLLGFVQQVIDSGAVTPDNPLVRSTPVTRVNSGLRYAYAFNPSFGAQVMFEFGYGSSIDRDEANEWTTAWGIALDYDLKPKAHVPIGFLLGYYNSNYDNSLVVTGLPVQFLLQINYTGRDDFEFGIAANYQGIREQAYDTKLQFVNLAALFKYYF